MFSFRPSLLALALFAAQAQAFDAFQIKDIRVEGIQRTEAGTVFSYLPVKVGETLTPEKASEAIKALYATGFFKDVRLETSNQVLIVTVEERPGIASVDFSGLKEFSKDDMKKGLKDLGLAEGRILDKSLLDKAEQELKRQYFNRGMYAVQVKATSTPLERNRVAVNFDVTEGEIAKIRAINLVGAKAFKEKELLKLLNLSTPGWMTWWTKNDQYSKQKLAGDLETLRSHYLNQGYLEFKIDSTQVSITPDKKDIYITINLSEGEKYTVSEFRLAGELPVPEEELKALVTLKPGEHFSREKLNESSKKIGDRLGNDGYAFANVNAAPDIDKEKRTASFTFLVDPGRKVHVRRVNVTGNTKTKDEVVRREMRQIEGAWYAADKITRSRERVERLGFFKETTLETPPVPGTTDQVDINVNVTEQPTGNILLGAGFSNSDGVVLSGSISQNNLFGSGNRLSLQINSGSVNKVYALSFTNPYYTPDGISLGYDIYKRKVDTSELDSVADYDTDTMGIGMRFGVPISEKDTINFGFAYEDVTLDINPEAPDVYYKYAAQYSSSCQGQLALNPKTGCTTDMNTVRMEVGWARDTRDSLMYPTKGTYQRVALELGTPLGDLEYYKLNYQYQWIKSLSRNVSLLLNGEIGIGDGYGDSPTLPLFRNFFAGGIGSVRGFDTGALGPKALNQDGEIFSIGGDTRVVGNAEVMFPFPGMGNDRSVRLSTFVDIGAVAGPGDEFDRYDKLSFSDMRYSAGLAVLWYSPMGPIKMSLAKPLNAEDDEEEQVFQFQLGNVF